MNTPLPTAELVADRDVDGNETRLLLRDPAGAQVAYLDVIEGGDELWVMEIGVRPDYRGRGCASRLLNTLLAEYPSDQIALSCGAFSPDHVWRGAREGLPDDALRAWYTRHGFRPDPREDEIEPERCMARLPAPSQTAQRAVTA
ncbi:GNAT family N-acetyltransferase [Streptomyces sp. NBC_00470]|uniref:GNAT family N-acetyltransferase n=1 Tax=Streptomyces sp. NBC_00470 TaxID=2975753 RepID=UPI002F90A09A